jgi:arylsulfatase A
MPDGLLFGNLCRDRCRFLPGRFATSTVGPAVRMQVIPVCVSASILALTLTFSALGAPAGDQRPNFLIILCDDLGYGDLASFGHPDIKTPHLDRLAADGIRLTDCYAAAPVCSPARAGLMTGRVPSRAGIYDWIPANHPMHLKHDEITIAKLLRSAGYDTAIAGKWHLNGYFNDSRHPQPSDHGFNHWFATQNNAAPSHRNPRNFIRNGQEVGELEGYACQLVADEGIQWLRDGRDKNKPFFLFISFHEPHEPVASPGPMVAMYPHARIPEEAEYFANVTNMDAAVGRIIETLDQQGLSENTLVFFTSDNGPETLNRYRGAERSYGTPGPLREMKLHVYEGGIRVPGILRWTGRIAPGQVVGEPISGVDLLPTMCELAGIEPPVGRHLDGTSFVPLLSGEPFERTMPLYWDYYRALTPPKVAMRDGDWKLLAHWDIQIDPRGSLSAADMTTIKAAQLSQFEVYNLREDIGEATNLADQDPDRLDRMVRQMRSIFQQVQQEGPVWQFEAR